MAISVNRINELERRLSILENQVMVQSDKAAITELMSKHQLMFLSGQGKAIVQDLWCKDETCTLEVGASGVFQGMNNVRSYYEKDVIPGVMSLYALTTPSIAIGNDGKMAIGNWIAIGTETDAGELGIAPPDEKDQRDRLLSSKDSEGKRYRAEWLWQRYCVGFIKTIYGWRIHDIHISEFFRCPFDQDWVKFADERMKTDGIWLEHIFDGNVEFRGGEHLPSGPSTYHWQYRTDASVDEMKKGL